MGRRAATAVLFWCYQHPQLCRNRLEVLRHHDPDVPVYVVYGGPLEHLGAFQQALEPFADDLWAFEGDHDRPWRWRNGDLMLADWFRHRGQDLEWDTVLIVQWDLLVVAPMAELLPDLQVDDVLLSGLRPLDEVRPWWRWSTGHDAAALARFEAWLDDQALPSADRWCCQFIVAALPRSFWERYAQLGEDVPGFLEYRIPTLAAAWGLRFRTDHPYDPWWEQDPEAEPPDARSRALNAGDHPVPLVTVLAQRRRPDGLRAFHPYHGLYPLGLRWAVRAPIAALARRAGRTRRWARAARGRR